ncbi:indole-3-glycerol phosphate synthase TrpC [Sphingomonas glacialis]|uniref:Indole-3-glycerol phosphate synthase n=1 Tax=Sphingomonas glacialis TaxID=658225 RepID=A0A502FIC3_9SPHN|nr:indole-3-glycerol phosphate synthase TrpC [Sphingomonas glacialis]TPG48992.1 indole-3-glycerol phosphate synthase TrpC [Sphingomonas glacialis]
MTDILNRILETKRADVAARKATTALSELDARIAGQSPPRGFRAALDARAAAGGYALVAEIKKASPSKGLIREDFDPPAHALAYQAGGATCLSVLTDEAWFQGSDGFLTAARGVCDLPVLRKDFMVDPWQVPESRGIGADAILLIMAALDDVTLAEIEASAIECGMDVLVEVHSQSEMERAMKLKSRLIGVNNRNLRDFTVDFARTYELVSKAPKDCTFVAESGLTTRADLDAMAEHGIRCFLIGEALMRQDDVETATRTLVG